MRPLIRVLSRVWSTRCCATMARCWLCVRFVFKKIFKIFFNFKIKDKYIPTFDPVDVLLLLNLIKNQKSLKDAEVWLPVCLPKLEEGHSLQAHISYIDEWVFQNFEFFRFFRIFWNFQNSKKIQKFSETFWIFWNFPKKNFSSSTRLCLILVSRDRSPENFHALQKVRADIIGKMTKKKLFDELNRSSSVGLGYSVADIGIVDLEHFLYFW